MPGFQLYVDDIRKAPEGWQLAQTITEAIRILATQDVTEVSLDHDICCRLVTGQEHILDEDFTAVAYYIAKMKPRPIVHFHTSNSWGESRMRSILNEKQGKAS